MALQFKRSYLANPCGLLYYFCNSYFSNSLFWFTIICKIYGLRFCLYYCNRKYYIFHSNLFDIYCSRFYSNNWVTNPHIYFFLLTKKIFSNAPLLLMDGSEILEANLKHARVEKANRSQKCHQRSQERRRKEILPLDR